MRTRRDFLKGAAACGAALCAASEANAQGSASKPLNILILGGTGAIGPFHVRAALERGHRVAVFSRGRRQADLPASVEMLVGDRNGNLQSIQDRDWDAVLD